MKYQRVLYTNKFSTELKSKLRIASFDKRRSLKGNVYYIGFASDADMSYADRICKRLRNVTMKPFQLRSPDEVQYQRRSKQYEQEENHGSPSPTIAFIAGTNCDTVIYSSKQINNQVVELVSGIQASNFVSHFNINDNKNFLYNIDYLFSILKSKQQLIDDVQSCLNVIKTTQRAADDVYQNFKNGMDCDAIMDRLLQMHSTAFYLKAATSIKIKDILSTGIRLSWPNITNDINEFRLAVGYEQSFMMKMASAQHILSKINNQSSMTMSSKLAYQLVKLSH
uniref:Uncharacterized protein n=1 Tax=Adineta vaga TaxID=104782 RepID=G3KGW2_ADIVA|nr:hypothetical protein [Adineta vaga]